MIEIKTLPQKLRLEANQAAYQHGEGPMLIQDRCRQACIFFFFFCLKPVRASIVGTLSEVLTRVGTGFRIQN